MYYVGRADAPFTRTLLKYIERNMAIIMDENKDSISQMNSYEAVIGIEVHVELSTNSKIFCGCSVQFGGEAGTRCCPVCMGMPGTLPILNKKVVEYAIAAGLALNCTIAEKCSLDRKNYFYPDLPKAYQISQKNLPLCSNGYIDIGKDKIKRIRIREIHIEEDAGKLVHDSYKESTLVDFNRCGIPLIEIVSEPDLCSVDEAAAYLEKLKLILEYLNISDCRMQEGSLRADINISVRKPLENEYGIRTEMKNLNSIKAMKRAIESESKRQIELLEAGMKVVQETRRWEDAKCESTVLRSKEGVMDYRYVQEPDIPAINISDEWVLDIKSREPEFKEEKMLRYIKEYGVSSYDADSITSSKEMSDIFEKSIAICNNAKEISNWLIGEARRLMRETDAMLSLLKPCNLASFIQLIEAGTINRTTAKKVFKEMFLHQTEPVEYVMKMNLTLENDEKTLKECIRNVLSSNEKPVKDYLNGKEKAFDFLVGQVMKKMKGRVEPMLVNRLIKESIS